MAWEPDYLTLSEFKNYIRITAPNDNIDDAVLPWAITAASRAIDKCCSERKNGMGARRQFGKVDALESRYYTPRWDQNLLRWVIEIDDLYDSAGLLVEIDTGNDDVYGEFITDYVLRPKNALAQKRVYTQIAVSTRSNIQPVYFPDSARVTTDKWGWSAFPVTIKEGAAIQGHRFAKRRQSPLGTTGSPQKGTEQKVIEDVDPDIELMLKSYVKLGWTL